MKAIHHSPIQAQGHHSLIQFSLEKIQFLDHEGNWICERPSFASDQWLVHAYKHMVLNRVFDNKAIALQRTGQMGTYPSSLGQEAFGVAIGMALQKDDVFVPYYRDHGAHLLRGHKMSDLLLYWGGMNGVQPMDLSRISRFVCPLLHKLPMQRVQRRHLK